MTRPRGMLGLPRHVVGEHATSIPGAPEFTPSPFWRQPARLPDGRFVPDADDAAPCRKCGGSRAGERRGNHGYCRTCYRRWADHGYPDGGPPPVTVSAGPGGRAERAAEYARLHAARLNMAQIAARLGVTRRTLQRYEAARVAAELAAPRTRPRLRSGHYGYGGAA